MFGVGMIIAGLEMLLGWIVNYPEDHIFGTDQWIARFLLCLWMFIWGNTTFPVGKKYGVIDNMRDHVQRDKRYRPNLDD